jgi:hypothetical protein
MPTRIKRGLSSILDTFAYRLFVNCLFASLAYLFVIQVIFPKYIAPLAAFHEDMYIGADMAALGLPFATFLFWPRPVLWLLIRLGGQLGFEGSVIFTTAITLISLALALTLLERFVLRRVIPWWLSLGTLMLAMAGANFYFVAGYDIGTSAALFFGLAGIYVAESRKPTPATVLLTLLLFILSSLTKESFLPALGIYGIARALRRPFSRANAIFMALPFLAAAVALIDARLVHSMFVVLSSGAENPYRISLAPPSLLESAAFYIAPLENVPLIVLLLCCAFGVWINGRARIAIGLLTASLALYLPYLILPNHRLGYYQWAPMPLLMLLVPVAWTPRTDAAGEPRPELGTPRVRLAARAAIVVALIFAIVGLGAAEYSPFGNWSLGQQEYNRSVIAGIRSLEPALRSAKTVLVVGVSNVFHPWSHAEFLSRELGFSGMWYVAAAPGERPIGSQAHAQPIAYDRIRWSDYDLVVVFANDGRLAGSYRGSQVEDIARSRGAKLSNLDVVAVLQARGAQSAPSAAPEAATNTRGTLPRGLSYAAAQQPGPGGLDGLYASDVADDPSCCWISPEAILPATVTAGTRELDLHVYLPDYPPFAQHGQTITLSAPETGILTRTVPIGSSDVIVQLSHPSARNGLVRLSVRSSTAIVPADLGLGEDRRHLALIVRSVEDRR